MVIQAPADSEILSPRPVAHRGWRVFVALVLFASLALILAGLTMPALKVTSFAMFGAETSILDSIAAFRDDGQPWLAGFLYLVSAIFPIVKIILALLIVATFRPQSRATQAIAQALAELSRWSMTDVFILAVAVIVIDGRLIATADLLPGAYYFAGGVLLSTVAVHIVRAALRRAQRQNLSGT